MDETTNLGSKLKQARVAKGISLEDVQQKTKIPIDVLRSIERDEKIRNLSPIYLKGFLKIYAKFLGIKAGLDSLPSKASVSLTRAEKSSPLKEQKIALSLNKKINYFFWLKIFISLVIVIALIYFLISLMHKRKSPPKEAKASVVSSVKPHAVPLLAKATRIKLSLRAKEDTWLQVKCDGKSVFRSVLRKGASESWVAKDKFELSIGNASALELEVNNKIISPLGRRGQAIKNIIITKDSLLVKN